MFEIKFHAANVIKRMVDEKFRCMNEGGNKSDGRRVVLTVRLHGSPDQVYSWPRFLACH